jgi:hypothetical protein
MMRHRESPIKGFPLILPSASMNFGKTPDRGQVLLNQLHEEYLPVRR